MRLLVLLSSIAMAVVAYLWQRGLFGPDNGAVSDQYPTLVVAAVRPMQARAHARTHRTPVRAATGAEAPIRGTAL